jgi:peptide deformylase
MAILEIVKYPHAVLKRKCEKIERVDESLDKLIRDMTETMYDAGGIGLAACQVGISRRVIVVDVSPIDPEKALFTMINPEIICEEGEIEHEEGCLSVPDCSEKVKRRERLLVRGISAEGKGMEISANGILAIALQHEIDHLNGILILDRMSQLKRELYRNKLKKERRKEESP